jgi:pimeloyl-ACP methyl ester carboxylesterase
VHAQAGALNVGIANSTRLVIRDAAHLLPLEQPELFNKALSEFVRAPEPRAVSNKTGRNRRHL